MKKLYTFIAALMAAFTAYAQDVCFVDGKGNALADGSVVTMNKVEVNDFDETIVPLTGLSIRNNTGSEIQVKLLVTADSFSGRSFACCVGTSCHNLTKAGTVTIERISVKPGSTVDIINTEWVVNPGGYGKLSTKFVLESQKGHSSVKQAEVTVNFVYKDPASVDDPMSSSPKVVKTYDITGRETHAHKGLLLQLMSDGSVRKVIR